MNAKRFQSGLIIISVFFALTTAAIGQTTTESMTPKASKKKDITGTWLVNLSINAQASKAPPQIAESLSISAAQAPFVAVETFHADGTFIENSLTDYLPPQTAPGHGVWEKASDREFALTIYGVLVVDVSNPQFGGTYKVRSKLTLNGAGSEFSGPFVLDIFDPTGTLVATLEGTAQGRRAASEPLP